MINDFWNAVTKPSHQTGVQPGTPWSLRKKLVWLLMIAAGPISAIAAYLFFAQMMPLLSPAARDSIDNGGIGMLLGYIGGGSILCSLALSARASHEAWIRWTSFRGKAELLTGGSTAAPLKQKVTATGKPSDVIPSFMYAAGALLTLYSCYGLFTVYFLGKSLGGESYLGLSGLMLMLLANDVSKPPESKLDRLNRPY